MKHGLKGTHFQSKENGSLISHQQISCSYFIKTKKNEMLNITTTKKLNEINKLLWSHIKVVFFFEFQIKAFEVCM